MIKCLIIGGGAAGLMSAISFADSLVDTTLPNWIVDHSKRVGQKLLITGNGRCNLTNILSTEEFINYGFSRSQQRFIKNAIYEFPPTNVVDFFEGKVELILSDNFHYFPKSQKSSDILDVFLKKLIKILISKF